MDEGYKVGRQLVSVGMLESALSSWDQVTGGQPRSLDSVITSAAWGCF